MLFLIINQHLNCMKILIEFQNCDYYSSPANADINQHFDRFVVKFLYLFESN